MVQFSFEKLTAWQLSRNFVKKIYQVTAEFPEEEKYGLVSQLRRASISISSNLAREVRVYRLMIKFGFINILIQV